MLINGNALHIPLADKSVQMCVTSPPYWGLRDYGIEGQFGLEQTPEEYVMRMKMVFREVKRVLRDDGTLWLNLGDSYAGSLKGKGSKSFTKIQASNKGSFTEPKEIPQGLKPKDLVGISWRVAFALQADGWYLRNDIIWHKPNPMPESVKDRCTKSHEYIFLLTKNKKYYYDNEAVKEPATGNAHSKGKKLDPPKGNEGRHKDWDKLTPDLVDFRNKRTVWTMTTRPYSGAHFATFPPELPEICIKAGSAEGDTILDPFVGSGTTCMVARDLGRQSVGIDLSFDYLVKNAKERLQIDKLEYWKSGAGKEVEENYSELPIFKEIHP